MLSLFEPATLIGNSNLNSALKLYSCTIACMERLTKLQLDAINSAVSESHQNLQVMLDKPGAVNLLEYWQNAYQTNIEKTMELGRLYTSEITKTQAEVTQLMGELTTTMNKNAVKNLEDLTRTTIEEGEKAASVVQHPSKPKRTA